MSPRDPLSTDVNSPPTTDVSLVGKDSFGGKLTDGVKRDSAVAGDSIITQDLGLKDEKEVEEVEAVSEETIAECEALLLREASNCGQWKKQLLNGLLILTLIMVNLFLGSKHTDSLVGI
jgi:hypothetical protein